MRRGTNSVLMFKREFSRNLRALLIWTAALIAFNIMMTAFFSSISDQAEIMKEFTEVFPESFASVFGLDRLDMTTILGYYGVEMYLFITLFGSIYAMLLSSGMLSREESEGTAEFLLSKPVTRNMVVTAKGICIIINLVLFNLGISLANFAAFGIASSEPFSMKAFLLLSAAPLLLHLSFASLGYLASVFITKSSAIYPVSLGIVLGSYFLSVLASVSEKTENVKYLSFFKYAEAADIITNEKIRPLYVVIMLAVITTGTLLTYYFYSRKDITA